MNPQTRIDENIGAGRELLQRLLATEPIRFKGMTGQSIPAEPGVYAIKNYSTADWLYAGKSRKAKDGLRNRIYVQHRTGRESSDFAKILIDRRNDIWTIKDARKWMIEHCEVHLMTEDEIGFDPNWAENFMIAVLRPKYNKQ